MEIYVFIFSLAAAILARILVDKRKEKQGRSRIGWIIGFAVFFAVNGLYSLLKK